MEEYVTLKPLKVCPAHRSLLKQTRNVILKVGEWQTMANLSALSSNPKFLELSNRGDSYSDMQRGIRDVVVNGTRMVEKDFSRIPEITPYSLEFIVHYLESVQPPDVCADGFEWEELRIPLPSVAELVQAANYLLADSLVREILQAVDDMPTRLILTPSWMHGYFLRHLVGRSPPTPRFEFEISDEDVAVLVELGQLEHVFPKGVALGFVPTVRWNEGTALEISASRGHAKAVQRLLTAGAAFGNALIEAAERDRAGMVKFLLAQGVDVNKARADGDTALIAAARSESYSLTDINIMLLEAGADVNKANASGDTALMAAVSRSSCTPMVHLLLEAGADVNKANAAGDTALIIAAAGYGNFYAVEALLNANATVDLRNALGETVLDMAKNKRIRKALEQVPVSLANQKLVMLHRSGKLPADLLPLLGSFAGAQGEQVRRREARSLTEAALALDTHQVRQMLSWASPDQVAAALDAVRPKGDKYRGVVELLASFRAPEGAKRIKLHE
jgi:hypothetical protein